MKLTSPCHGSYYSLFIITENYKEGETGIHTSKRNCRQRKYASAALLRVTRGPGGSADCCWGGPGENRSWHHHHHGQHEKNCSFTIVFYLVLKDIQKITKIISIHLSPDIRGTIRVVIFSLLGHI